MPRFALQLIENSVIISTSQEEAFEAIAGWDNAHQAVDDTPSQPADAESTEISPQLPEKIIPLDIFSKRPAASDAAMIEEDSYNEAFESDRSQSPSRTLSWSLSGAAAAAVARDGCSKDPTSPTWVTTAGKETEKSPLKLKVTSKVKLSNSLSYPPEAAVTSASRVEVQVHQEKSGAEQDAQERCGGRGTSDKANYGGGGVPTTAEFEGRPSVSSKGIRVAGSSSARDTQIFGSGSSSPFTTLGRKEQHSEPAFPVEQHSKFGFEGVHCERSTPNVIDQITNSVQDNTQVLVKMVVGDDHSEKDPKSGDDFDSRKFGFQYELNSSEKFRERVLVDTDPIPPSGLRDELERHAGFHCQDGSHVKFLSRKEKSNEISCSQASARTVIGSSKVQSVQKPGAGVTPEDGRQHSPPSLLRPSRAVQEKLEKLRSQSGNKRAHSGISDLLTDRLREERENISSNTVLEAIKLRSGERSGSEVTAADLLKTALDVGISLPYPFHRNYFRE